MGIVRVKKDSNFTVMSNYHLRDPELSLKAVGLLSRILSLPPGWDFTIEGLTKICTEGKAAIRSAIEELEKAGYIVREQSHSNNGTFAGYDYTVYEMPPGKAPSCENRTMAEKAESPSFGFPSSDNPSSENRTQLNKDILNTDTPKAPRGRREPKKAPDWMPDRFKVFWKNYPRGENKQAAIRAWDRLRPDEETLLAMSSGLNRQLASAEWQRGIGIPYASTWLNNRRWEDEARAVSFPKPEGGSSWADDEEVRYV